MKKYIIAALAAIAVFAISAFAASLSVDAGTLQAGDDVIEPCIAGDIAVTYGEPALVNNRWVVDELKLDDAGNCDGLAFSVAVTSSTAAWTVTPTQTGSFSGGPATVTIDAFDAEEATDVHIVIRSAA